MASRAFLFAKYFRTLRQITRTFNVANSAGTIDSFDEDTYRAARYVITAYKGTSTQTTEILLQHNGNGTVDLTEYGTLMTGSAMATYTADRSGSTIRLRGTPSNAATIFKFKAEYVEA
jgi:hypothetical protein